MGTSQAKPAEANRENALKPDSKVQAAEVSRSKSPAARPPKSPKKAQTADLSVLKQSKLYASTSKSGAQLASPEDGVVYEDYRLSKLPHFKEVIRPGREEDYSIQSRDVRKSQFGAAAIHSLSFKIDDPEGVSEQADVYHFDYERTLNHYIQWENKNPMAASKSK